MELLEAFDVWLASDAPFLFGFRAGSTMFHSAPVEPAALATEEVAGRLDAMRSAKRAASILDLRWPRAQKSSEAPRDELVVICGNRLAAFTVWVCCEFMCAIFFVIENLDQSYLWLVICIIGLWSFVGVGFVRFVMRVYSSMFLKPAAFLTNALSLFKMCRVPLVGDAGPPCRGQIWWEGAWTFQTKFIQACPTGMCVQEANFVKIDLDELAWCDDTGITLKFNTRDTGNPMKSGPISRQCWISQDRTNTWEAFINDQDEECASECEESEVDEAEFLVVEEFRQYAADHEEESKMACSGAGEFDGAEQEYPGASVAEDCS